MYTKKVLPVMGMIMWTMYELLLFFAIGTVYVLLIEYLGLTWIKIP